MNTFYQFSTKYLKWVSPVAFVAATLSAIGKSGDNLFYDITGWATVIWIILLIFFVFYTSLNSQRRSDFVRRLAGIHENDERESHITGFISKKTFIFTTGILVLLLFLSIIRIEIYQNGETGADGKKRGMAQFGMAIKFLETPAEDKKSDRNYLINYQGLPLAADGTLVLIGLLQLGTFYYFSRKERAVN